MADPTWGDTTELSGAPSWDDTVEEPQEYDDLPPMEDGPESTKKYEKHGSEKLDAFLQNFADSGTFGFRDELTGAAGAGMDALHDLVSDNEIGGGGYETYRDASREDLEELSEDNPAAALSGQLAGYAVPGSAGGKVAGVGAKAVGTLGGKKLLDPMYRGLSGTEAVASGIAAGGLEGAGSSTGDDLLGDILRGAATGGGVGAGGKMATGLVGDLGEKMMSKAGQKMGKNAASKAIQEDAETKLRRRLEESLGHRKSRDIAKAAGDKIDVKRHKEALKPLRARNAAPGSISEVKTLIRDLKGMDEAELKGWAKALDVDVSPAKLGEIIENTTVVGSVIHAAGKTYNGMREMLKDLGSLKLKNIKKHAGKLAVGAAATSISPLGVLSPLLTAGAKNVDVRDLSNIYNIGKRGVGRKLSKAGTYGPTRATAAAMYGADATHQDQEVRTKEFLDQLHSKKARERMRNR